MDSPACNRQNFTLQSFPKWQCYFKLMKFITTPGGGWFVIYSYTLPIRFLVQNSAIVSIASKRIRCAYLNLLLLWHLYRASYHFLIYHSHTLITTSDISGRYYSINSEFILSHVDVSHDSHPHSKLFHLHSRVISSHSTTKILPSKCTLKLHPPNLIPPMLYGIL